MASVFSGKAGRNSAIWTAQQAQQQLGQLQGIYGTGREEADKYITGAFQPSLDALSQYYDQQRADLTGGGEQARADITGGRDQAIGAVQGGYGQALGDLGKYYGQATDTMRGAAEGWNPLVAQNEAGFKMYQNSLGLGGPEGTAAAQGAFQAGPGYQWNVDQATSQAARAGNKIGSAYSGNVSDASTRLASNLANQEYGKWQQNLQGFQAGSQNALTGQTGALTNLASLYQGQAGATSGMEAQQGRDIGGLYTGAATQLGTEAIGTGGALAGAAAAQGGNLASLQTNYGQSMANNALGYMSNLAGANQNYYGTVIPAGQQGFLAGQQAAANRTGALMGGLQMGAQALGGLGGMAGGGAGLFSKVF